MKEKTDSRDTLLALLKDKYEHEYARKKYFDDALGVPITLLSFLVGGVYYVINDSSNVQNLSIKIIFIVSTILLFCVCIATFYFLYQVYFTYNNLYKSFPDSEAINDYYNKFKKHQVDSGKKLGSFELEDCLTDNLKTQTISWYVEANTKNLHLNQRRGQNFINAKISLGLALVLGVVIFSLTCINKTLLIGKHPTLQNIKSTPISSELKNVKVSKADTLPRTEKK